MTEQIKPNNEPAFDLSNLPKKTVEIRAKAGELAGRLIDDPQLIPDFLKTVEDFNFQADVQGDREKKGQMAGFLSEVSKGVEVYDWTRKAGTKLSSDAARTLLLCLPPVDQKIKTSKQQDIVLKITRGYLDRRFEGKEVNDWRGALLSLRGFLESAVLPEPDLEALTAWFNLMVGKYQDCLPTYHSLAWRAFAYGTRAASPSDEKLVITSCEISHCLENTAELLGRRAEYQENSRNYTVLELQRATVMDMVKSGVRIEEEAGQQQCRQMIRKIAKRLTKLYPEINGQQLYNLPLPSDLINLVLTSIRYPERLRLMLDMLNRSYENVQEKTGFFVRGELKTDKTGKLVFPYDLAYEPSPLTTKILSLFDSTRKRQAMYEMAKKKAAQRGENWQLLPFALEGMQGYLIMATGINLSSAEEVKHISQLIKQHGVKERWERFKEAMPLSAVSMELDFPDFAFVLAKEEYLVKSQLESLLDLKIPEDIRQNALKYLMENYKMRQDIPKAFTRMPTKVGDKYDLIDNKDLPKTIESAVIRKTQDGGLEYILTFCTDELVFPDGEKPALSGRINFETNRVNINPAGNSPRLPTDQVLILENVLLNLLERSCCPSLKDVEEEMKQYESEEKEGVNLKSTPGYIGHIGGFRQDGGRKQYTQNAQDNWEAVFGQLHADLSDISLAISLAKINERHREKDSADDRFLTYYKGRDLDEVAQEPRKRSAPQNLISPISS